MLRHAAAMKEDVSVAQQQRVERVITTRYGRTATVVLNRGAM
jgi:hypothetical protein